LNYIHDNTLVGITNISCKNIKFNSLATGGNFMTSHRRMFSN